MDFVSIATATTLLGCSESTLRRRIADGSVMPFLGAVNPNITTMAIGEKCADMLKEDARA